MITDPKTTPNHSLARILWAIAVATIAFYLSTFKFINGTPIWVMVFAQPLVPMLNYLFKAQSFEWKQIFTRRWVQKSISPSFQQVNNKTIYQKTI